MAANATNPTDFLTPKPTSTGIIGAAQASSGFAPGSFTNYNGKQVLNDQNYMDGLNSATANYNKVSGKNLTAQEYDKQLNPTTYGARWGAPDGGAATPTTGTPTAVTAPAKDYTADIQASYQKYLGRDGEQAGVDFYQNLLNSGYTMDQINQGMQNSDEYKSRQPAANAVGVGAPSASSYTPTLLGDPAKWDVTKEQTVAGQMEKYADPNNPYTQMWGAQGAMGAAARGFTGNSTIRDTGILGSVMANATPIASADAATQAKAAGYNTDEANQFTVANQNANNTAGAFNAAQANQMETSKYTADTSAATQLGVTDKNNATALAQSNLSSNTQKYVADMSSSTQLAVTKMSTTSQAEISKAHDANSALIQGSTQAQQAYNSYVAAVAQIDQNPALDYNAKVAAINTQTQIFNSAITGLKAANPGIGDISSPLNLNATTNAADVVGGVDVSQYLNF